MTNEQTGADEPANKCELCDEADNRTAVEVVDIGYPDARMVKCCDDCVSELRECEFTNTLHGPEEEMTELGDGRVVCNYVFENDIGCCDWSDEYWPYSEMMTLGGGDTIAPHYEDETRHCASSGELYHVDEMQYVDEYDEWYHEDCVPQTADRWYNSFRKIYCNDFTKYPMRNFVGIEFEGENADTIGPDDFTNTYLAQAKEDGSLDYGGTEYTTHILRGNDVPMVIDEMMTRFNEYGWEFTNNAGWHFHYDCHKYGIKAQKNLWNAVEQFEELLRNHEETSSGFRYFTDMIRSYADYQHSQYRSWVSAWSKTQADYPYTDHFRRFQRHNASSPRSFVNFTPLRNRDDRRIEVRMYFPVAVMNRSRNGIETYNQLGDDYKMFIRFWDELFRKAVYRYNDLNFSPDMKTFAMQFSKPTQDWLVNKED